MDKIEKIKQKIMNSPENLQKTKENIEPLFNVLEDSKIIIIGQAPGIKAQNTKITWNDLSGDNLIRWLGVSREQFFNPKLFGQMPMDFYYPGKAKTGDLPPRSDFAPKWHPQILKCTKDVKLIILIGAYSQNFYLKDKLSLTKRVKGYQKYLPEYFVLPHPSPLNFRWQNQNPWFVKEVLPALKEVVKNIIQKN